ncbi:MAG: protein kinase [Polyangiaceae bacterium]|nr:protein kinase [Polyangiaceae bacterium]
MGGTWYAARGGYEALVLGTILNEKYRIERELGQGGMGAVYIAEDLKSHDRVAVKVIHAHLSARLPDLEQRFEREARAASAVDTEHIARCLDAGIDASTKQPFMVLELLVGDDFDRVLRSIGPVEPSLALRVTAQAALGLAAAHKANIVHRDIKPANLFLASKPTSVGERVVKILDFGVAKVIDDPNEKSAGHDGLTRTGSLLGSPLYMSPEQARSVKTVDGRTDIWSLGVVLYKALAGRTPYEHVSGLGDLVLALWNEPPPPVQQFASWVQPEIAALVDRMLRADPTERFQTMDEVHSAVVSLLGGDISIHDAALVPLAESTRSRAAQTFFRRFDTRNRTRSGGESTSAQAEAPVRAQTAQPPSSTFGESDTDPAMSKVVTPVASSKLEESAVKSISSPGTELTGSNPGQVTQTGLTTTGATRLGTEAGKPAPSNTTRGLVLAAIGLAVGVAAATLVLSNKNDSGPAPSGSTSALPSNSPLPEPAAVPDVTPSTIPSDQRDRESTGSAGVFPPNMGPSSLYSGAPSASASAPPSSSGPLTAPTVKPRPTSTTTTKTPGFTDFGDRK